MICTLLLSKRSALLLCRTLHLFMGQLLTKSQVRYQLLRVFFFFFASSTGECLHV
jgi:hypothetical protein